jgi:hypothetical protein
MGFTIGLALGTKICLKMFLVAVLEVVRQVVLVAV